MKNEIQVKEQEINSIVKEIEEAFWDIPFENSAFQNINFVVNQQFTPGRAYRAIGLRLHSKLRALQEAYFGRRIEEIDLAELEEKRDNPNTNKFEKMRTEIEIEKKLSHRNYTDKLINDAMVEVQTLYNEYKKLPRYNREMFENEEGTHFQARLNRQIQGVGGAAEALLAMQNPLASALDALGQQEAAQQIGGPEGASQNRPPQQIGNEPRPSI